MSRLTVVKGIPFIPLFFSYLASCFCLTASTLEVGLIGRYTFDGGNGADSSGNGNDASVLNATIEQGRFAGNNSYLCNANSKISVSLVNQNISTVSIWFKVGVIDHAYLTLYDSTAFDFFAILGNHPAYLAAGTVGYGYAGTNFLTPNSLADNNWHHFVSTYNSDNQKINIFLDGSFLGQGATAFPLNSSPIFMMGSQIGTSDMGPAGFSGLIDDIRIYSRSLSSSEVITLYSTESVPEPSALSLLAVGLGLLFRRSRKRD